MTTYCFGDTETTGLGNDSKAVEISWVETDENFNVIAKYHSLINPEMPIQYGAMSVHGITDAMVAEAPTVEEFMAHHGYPLAGEGKVLVAHNAPFDLKYFAPWMDNPDTICSLRCARIVYPEAENHKLGTLRYMLDLEGDHDKAHSAAEDVSVLIQLAQRMCADAGTDLKGLMELQKQKRKISVLRFGKKHYGKRLEDVPKDYVHWMLTLPDLDPDLRNSLEALHMP